MKRIKDVIPYDGSLSLFQSLSSYCPWSTTVNAARLELLYLTHSGNKICGPIFDVLTNDGENDFDADMMSTLARSISDFYSNKWQRLWDVQKAEYEPLENYNMIEHSFDKLKDDTTTKTDGSQSSKSNSQSTSNATASDDNGRYGFASATAVNTDTGKTQSDTEGKTYGEGEVITDDTVTVDGTKTNERDLTRAGNIGIRSSQELLTQEIELWQWQYFETVFNDIDKLIALAVY